MKLKKIWFLLLGFCTLTFAGSPDGIPTGRHGNSWTGVQTAVQPGSVALFIDSNPNDETLIQDILTAHSIPFTILGSSDMATANLASFDKVVIGGLQAYSFYTVLSANRARFDSYVQ